MTVIAIASEVGIEMQTTIALRHERRKKTIAMPVSRSPARASCVTISICCSVNFDWTLMTRKLISGNCRSICGSARSTLFEASTSLPVDVFWICRKSPGLPLMCANCRRGSFLCGHGRDVADADDRVARRPRIDRRRRAPRGRPDSSEPASGRVRDRGRYGVAARRE